MGQRAEALVREFEQANRELISAVEGCSDEKWRSKCAGEGWSVGVVARHVASGHPTIAGVVRAVASGQALPPLTMEMLDQMNAKQAQEHAACTKAETLALLEENAQAAAGVVRGLSDEQLERSATVLVGMPPMTVLQVIQGILIGHVGQHSKSIKAALGG